MIMYWIILAVVVLAFAITLCLYKYRIISDRKAEEAAAQREQQLNEEKARSASEKRIEDEKLQKELIAKDPLLIIGLDGKEKEIWRRQTYFGDVVLISDGGRTYHTHADCFEEWEDEYFDKFTGWKEVSLKEVRKKGYRECRYCEKYYDFIEEV